MTINQRLTSDVSFHSTEQQNSKTINASAASSVFDDPYLASWNGGNNPELPQNWDMTKNTIVYPPNYDIFMY